MSKVYFHVDLIPQATDKICWYASAQMLKRYGTAHGKTYGAEPAELTKVVKSNKTINTDVKSFEVLAGVAGLRTIPFTEQHRTPKGLLALLTQVQGPIWYCGENNDWFGASIAFHVVVITGVKGDIIHFNDPLPVKKGRKGSVKVSAFFKHLDVLMYPWAVLAV